MKSQYMCFFGILALLTAAVLVVSAQEAELSSDDLLNNTTLNNTTMSNATASDLPLNDTPINDTLNATLPEEASVITSDASVEDKAALEALAQDMPAPTGAKIFTIGSVLNSDKIFVVNGNANPKQTFEVGIPIKPMRDVSKMVFVCDIV